MLVFLDSVIVIYAIEGSARFQARANARLATMGPTGDTKAVSALTRLECRVRPLRVGDATRIADFDRFLTAADVQMIDITIAVFERAAEIRAYHGFKLADSLHL